MSHTEYSAQFVQYSSVFLGLEEAPKRQLVAGALCDSPELKYLPWRSPII